MESDTGAESLEEKQDGEEDAPTVDMDVDVDGDSSSSDVLRPAENRLDMMDNEDTTEIQYILPADKDDDLDDPETWTFQLSDEESPSAAALALEEPPPPPRPPRVRGRGRGLPRTSLWTESRPLIIPPARKKKQQPQKGPRGRPRGSSNQVSMRGRTLAAPSPATKTVPAVACEECNRLFSSVTSLEAHCKSKHSSRTDLQLQTPSDLPPLPPVPPLPPARLRVAMTASSASVRGGRSAGFRRTGGMSRQLLQHMMLSNTQDSSARVHRLPNRQYCQTCDRYFANATAYIAHCKVVHHSTAQMSQTLSARFHDTESLTDSGMFQCPLCTNQPFVTSKDRARHVQFAHPGRNAFECVRCGHAFEQFPRMQQHLRRTHSLVQAIGNFRVLGGGITRQEILLQNVEERQAMSMLDDGVGMKRQEPFVCNLCGVSFGRPEPLAGHHLDVHVNGIPSGPLVPTPHKCAVCGEGFALDRQRVEHMTLEHARDGAFDCQECGCVFASFISLRRHHRCIHNLFTCDLKPGQQMSRQVSRLQQKQNPDDSDDDQLLNLADTEAEAGSRAMDMHRVVKKQLHQLLLEDLPDSEEAALAQSQDVEEMMKMEDVDQLEMNLYVCQQCGEGFHNKTELGKHIITHVRRRARFGCKKCGQIFEGAPAKKDLIDHVKVDHMGRQPWSCADCGRTFVFTSALKKHRYRRRCENSRSLRRMPAYGCANCDKIFCARGAAERYMKHASQCPGPVIRARAADLPPPGGSISTGLSSVLIESALQTGPPVTKVRDMLRMQKEIHEVEAEQVIQVVTQEEDPDTWLAAPGPLLHVALEQVDTDN